MEQLRHHWCDEDGCPGRLRRHVDPASAISTTTSIGELQKDSSPCLEDKIHVITYAKVETSVHDEDDCDDSFSEDEMNENDLKCNLTDSVD